MDALRDVGPVEVFEDRADVNMGQGASEEIGSRVLDVLLSIESFGV